MAQSRTLNVLITGGARGIGRGLFRHFIRAGHHVFILDNNTTELQHTIKKAQEWAPSDNVWAAVSCDLSNRSEIKQTVSDARKFFGGKLDVLINNAFSFAPPEDDGREGKSSDDLAMEDWDDKLAVGLTAPFLLSRLCLDMLKAGGTATSPGTIINISSTRAYQSELYHEAYSAVKAGILGLTQSMAVTLGSKHKIRVNAIVPGWIHVVNECKEGDEKGVEWEKGLSKQDQEWHPAGRAGKVEDLFKAVEYLVGAEFVTGTEVVVDGGVGRKMVYPE